ncbi:hypothetical protein EYF80_067557 [Liparis tanakae]|uniref:Uncharacterized protein n=1 Tax=Liparis tanakae TaxID=230148 RepID=A0A4Z2E0S2_9TELE|nr:hypothetical protein EYF80_067557 [Liparis tanakae]
MTAAPTPPLLDRPRPGRINGDGVSVHQRSMPRRSPVHPELVVNSSSSSSGAPPASRGHQGGVSVPICRGARAPPMTLV